MSTSKFSLLGLLLACNIFLLSAQEDPKYLGGAVPLVDGKVIFEREVEVDPSISAERLLGLASNWVKEEFEAEDKKYPESNQRILLVSNEDKYLVVQGDEKLVFKSQVLMIDQAIITYQLIVGVAQGKCTLTMRNIKYEYQDYKDLVPAEEMITDKYALHKNGDKLHRHYDKFRRFTIDRVDAIADSFKTYVTKQGVGVQAKEVVKATEITTPATPVAPQSVLFTAAGYKQMQADELTDDIIGMFKDNWVLVLTEKGGDTQLMPAMWTGKGNMGGKAVAMSLVKSDGHDADTYTISFYTAIHKKALENITAGGESKLTTIVSPTGSKAFAEAWMIIECKKVLDQPATENMQKDAQSKEWNVGGFDKLLMGEILNVWVR